MTGPSALVRGLAAAFLRSALLRRAGVVVLAVASVLTATYLVLDSLSLAAGQLQERDLGRFEASMDIPVPAPDPDARDTVREHEVAAAAVDAARRAGAQEAAAILTSFEVRPDPSVFTLYVEADWHARPFPDRYVLTSGRWPSTPGEVVATEAVTDSIPGTLEVPATLEVLNGNESLSVVGKVEDRYGTSSSKLLAAAGTWASFDWEVLDVKVAVLSAIPTVLWAGVPPEVVIDEVTDVPLLREDASGDEAGDALRSRLSRSVVDPIVLAQRAAQGYVDTVPAAYTVPSVLLPPLAVAVAFAAAALGLARNQRILTIIGVRRRDATAAVALATSVVAVAGAAIGVLVGTVGATLLRPAVALLATQPLSPLAAPISPTMRIMVGAVLASLICSAYLVSRTRASLTGRLLTPTTPRGLRRIGDVAVVVTVLILVWQLAAVDSVGSALAVAGTATVLAVFASSRLLDRAGERLRGARGRLAAARLQTDRIRAVTVISLVAALVGPPVAVATVIDMVRTYERESLVSAVPRGQVQLTTGSLDTAPPEEVVELAASAAGTTPSRSRCPTSPTTTRQSLLRRRTHGRSPSWQASPTSRRSTRRR